MAAVFGPDESDDTADSPSQGALAALQAPDVSPAGRAWGENYLKEHPEGVDTTGESALLQQQDADAQEARTALQKARERLASQRMDPSVLGLRFAQAMMSPSKYGIQDQWGKAAGAVADWRQQNQDLQNQQEDKDSTLAEQLAGVDKQSLSARLALQELKERTQASLMGTALKATATPLSAKSPVGKMVEDKLGVGSLQTAEGQKLFDAYAAQAHEAKTPAPGSGVAGWDQQDIDLLADRYADTGISPNVGVGKDAIPIRQAIFHSATMLTTGKRDRVSDASGQGASAAISGNAAGIKAAGSTLTDMTKRTATADASEQTALTNLALVRHYMQGADQSGIPLWNNLSNKIRSNVMGDPDVSAYQNAIATARNEYARVISMATGAQGLTDHAMKEGQKLFPDNLAPEQFEKNFQVAQQEMANRTGSMHEQVANAKKSLYKGPQGAATITPTVSATGLSTPPPTNTKGWALHKDKDGNQAYVSPDGKSYEEIK